MLGTSAVMQLAMPLVSTCKLDRARLPLQHQTLLLQVMASPCCRLVSPAALDAHAVPPAVLPDCRRPPAPLGSGRQPQSGWCWCACFWGRSQGTSNLCSLACSSACSPTMRSRRLCAWGTSASSGKRCTGCLMSIVTSITVCMLGSSRLVAYVGKHCTGCLTIAAPSVLAGVCLLGSSLVPVRTSNVICTSLRVQQLQQHNAAGWAAAIEANGHTS